VRYEATAAENIALPGTAAARAEVEAAARAAGAAEFIARLPNGYDTLLGRWVSDGVELSVGEWQRIALARAFLRPAPILLLDEPTSAMDSWAEADWLERLRELAAGRTAIIVTHRFTTAMRADLIHVMENGRIVESGSHADLVARGGRYAQSWSSQMRAKGASLASA
jgi:ATP-binding cassette subfamily B protein